MLAQATDYIPCAIVAVPIIGVLAFVVWAFRRSIAIANTSADLVRSRSDFDASDVYVSHWDLNGLAIDAISSRLLIVRGGEQRIILAKNIISVEVIADDATLVKTNRGSQAVGAGVGAILFGPAGFVVGGLSGSRRHERRVVRLLLRIVTTEFDCPNHDVLLHQSIDGKGDAPDSFTVMNAMQLAETWHSRVSALIRHGEALTESTHVPSSPSLADELRKLEDLRRDGVLTDEEFAAQKRLLLDK